MKLKKHGAFLVNFVIDFANGDMSRWEFDMDYSGYVIEHFPEFQREHPHLSRKFADTIERAYSACSWMLPFHERNSIMVAAMTSYLSVLAMTPCCQLLLYFSMLVGVHSECFLSLESDVIWMTESNLKRLILKDSLFFCHLIVYSYCYFGLLGI